MSYWSGRPPEALKTSQAIAVCSWLFTPTRQKDLVARDNTLVDVRTREKSLETSLKLPPPPCQMVLVPASAMQAAVGENSFRSYPVTYLVLGN